METAALCKPIQRFADLLRIPGTWVLTGLGQLLAALGSFPHFPQPLRLLHTHLYWRFLECQSIEVTLTQNGHLTHHEIPSVASLRPGGHFPRIGWPVSPQYAMYEWAAKRLLRGVCIYGQVIKQRRENRVVRVDRRLLLGTQAELEEALFYSEDSSTLNTSFVERHNLTIRQGCSYLGRRTPCHARHTEFLEGQVALLMAYYNFLRPHRALKFGKTLRTPAMQAGLAKKRLTFRDVFTSQVAFFLFVLMMVVARYARLDLRSVQFGHWRGNGSTTLA